MERRELLRWMVSTGGLAAFNRLSERDLVALGEAMHQQPRATLKTLTTAQARVITVAAEHIIPAGDTPGATDAKVTAFIDGMMADWYTPTERTSFVNGLAELDTRSRAAHNKAFTECATADQIALLETIDKEVTEFRRTRGAAANDHWFAVLKYLTVWGYCTSEPGMRKTLKSHPAPMRYDGNAPVA
jgi:hypothetical protein